MSTKRSRAHFEADLQAQQSPFVVYGTPLPPLDPEVRDDGSYVPVWKQEVRDERGRKRLHGAFTGGWSAGYFNTVGSKEGWTPSTFVSSRTKRWKDGQDGAKQQRPEDYMDEEDLAEQAEDEKLHTASVFSGLGSTDHDTLRRGGLVDLFRVQGETMGSKLLKRMGWKEGQGIGPKVRRKARLGMGDQGQEGDNAKDYLFAPDDAPMIALVKKLDRKGLGFAGERRLSPITPGIKKHASMSSDEEDEEDGPLLRPGRTNLAKKKIKPKGGFGIGILNDTGSDDEDPYEIGPRISYNRTIGGNKKKKWPNATAANPRLRTAPIYVSKKDALAHSAKSLRRCHDGRLPLDGFVLGTESDSLISMINSEGKYPPPKIPPDWKSAKTPTKNPANAAYISTADAARASTLDPKSRAALLGEAQLPGKSVFDFLSKDARERLAAVTGNTHLPPALGEIPEGYALTPEERQRALLAQIPHLEKETAIAALTRGASGSGPYADNEAKRARYRAYLEYSAGFGKASMPTKLPSQSNEEWLNEIREFNSCAKIFKPMSGFMASRFTTASSASKTSSVSTGTDTELLSKPAPKPADPAEEAAKLGMYGAMTRSITDFFPTRLLCKRFNVRPPAHVQPEGDVGAEAKSHTVPSFEEAMYGNSGIPLHGSAMTLDELIHQAGARPSGKNEASGEERGPPKVLQPVPEPAQVVVDANVNEALEGKRAQDAVFRAIFGDSSDDEG